MSLLAVALVGCEGMDAVHQIQPAEGSPEVTIPAMEEPSEVAAPTTEEPPKETVPQTEEPLKETVLPTEEPPEVTTPAAEAPPKETAPATEEPSRPAISNISASYPSAPGTAVAKNASAVIDYSNAKDGYVMVKWTGEAVKVAVQVTGPNNPEKYTYYPRTDGNYDVLPLSDGVGTYKIVVCKNVSGTKYAQALSASVSVKLDSSLAPLSTAQSVCQLLRKLPGGKEGAGAGERRERQSGQGQGRL